MTPRRLVASLAGSFVLSTIAGTPALALPTMIRLGYTNCVACHLAPQGGGLLNDYGRAVDQAQSLRGGEYRPMEDDLVKALNWNSRVTQDFRVVLQEQSKWADSVSAASTFRPRLTYRNATQLGRSLRLSATIAGEAQSAVRPTVPYDPPVQPGELFVNSILVHYRAGDAFEIAGGRDQLPTGINIPDLGVFARSRNRQGFYDAPAQVKMFWWGRRHQVSPFVFGPSGNEPFGEREAGAGTLAEFDVLGNQKTVVGISLLRGAARDGDRRAVGGYARLGFGSWGVLAEHDSTERTRQAPALAAFRQEASYAQVFWAMREWLVASAIGERLRVQSPFEQRLNAGKLEIAARLASQATLSVGARLERDQRTGRVSKSLLLQAALKTVN